MTRRVADSSQSRAYQYDFTRRLMRLDAQDFTQRIQVSIGIANGRKGGRPRKIPFVAKSLVSRKRSISATGKRATVAAKHHKSRVR